MNEKIVDLCKTLDERVVKRVEAGDLNLKGREFLAIQVTLKDIDGCFHILVKDDNVFFEPGEYPERQTEIIMSSTNFIKMINKELNSMVALTTGKLKLKGDITKAKALKELFGK
ncbi:MAG: SCP2 sterol-binding domain-containing protein [Oscillospiraceae bacterium]|nr:SCP2 sterol-binding domain-containing protein [Oscillospiraceae bacterium]